MIKANLRKPEKEILFTNINLLPEDKIKILTINKKKNFNLINTDLASYKYSHNDDLINFCQTIIDYCQELAISLDLDSKIRAIIQENEREKQNYNDLITLAGTLKTLQNINQTNEINNWEKNLKNVMNEKHQSINKAYWSLIKQFQVVFQEKTKANITLYNKQKMSVFYHLILPASCNFSVPGSGKTLIGLSLFFFYEKIKNFQKLLLITPLSSYISWKDEYCKFFKNSNKNHFLEINTIPKENRAEIMKISNYQFLLINYENLFANQELLIDFLKKNDVFLIFDEAHKIKNYSSKRTKVALKVAQHCSNKLILTGTPMPKGYEDLKNYFNIISNPLEQGKIIKKEIKTLKDMTKNPEYYHEDIQKLEKTIENYYFRINKKDLNLIPTQTEHWTTFANDQEHQKIYQIIEQRLINELKNFQEKIQLNEILKARIYRLMQVSIDPRMVINTKKTWKQITAPTFNQDQTYNDNEESNEEKKIYQILMKMDAKEKEQIEESKLTYQKTPQRYYYCLEKVQKLFKDKKIKKIIIWSCWVFVIEKLKELFETKYKTVIIYGATSYPEREKIFHDFQKENGKTQILICNPASVSESVSLHQYCHDAIYFDMTWNALYYLQSKDRIHRYQTKTQEKKVNYHILIQKNSIDEKIWNNIFKKEELMLTTIESKRLTPTKEEKTETLLEKIYNDYQKQSFQQS